jgi:hypothetical protein
VLFHTSVFHDVPFHLVTWAMKALNVKWIDDFHYPNGAEKGEYTVIFYQMDMVQGFYKAMQLVDGRQAQQCSACTFDRFVCV